MLPQPSREARINLAIQAINRHQNMSVRRAAQTYKISKTTLLARMKGRVAKPEKRHPQHKLTKSEEESLIQYVLDLDARGFPPRISGIKDMADLLLATRHGQPTGINWAQRFIQSCPELKTRLSRTYDKQRALCEDPDVINAWFRLVANMRAKYGILDCDLYNFDETGFMMGVICSSMVVTGASREGRRKHLQAGDREWATAIECVSSDGFVVPPYLILQGKYHLASWYTEADIPDTWRIKTSPNGWTDNETAMDWIRHFDQHTEARRKGVYRMIVLDGHESHLSAQFEAFCKEKNIITLCLPAHSSHLTQPLDVGCFSVLKRIYGKELEDFIKASVDHITKIEFLIAFRAAHNNAITKSNILGGFRGAGLVPFDPQAIISKLDIKLQTPTPTGSPVLAADPWVSQTPHNPMEIASQSQYIRDRMARHQGSSPTPTFSAMEQLMKGASEFVHLVTLLKEENKTLRKANEALGKRRRAQRTRLQDGGSLNREEAQVLIDEKEAKHSKRSKLSDGVGDAEARPATQRRCGNCGKTGHNVRTCHEVEETSDEGSCIIVD